MGLFLERKHKAIVEALLFMADRPLSQSVLGEVAGLSSEEILILLEELKEEYSSRESGLILLEEAGGYRLCTRPELAGYIEKLYKTRPPALSQAALETLAIVAYRQPVTRAEIEEIRGVKVEGVLSTLLERGLLRELGRKEGPGRPVLFGTTKDFLSHFGLNELKELPPLDEKPTT